MAALQSLHIFPDSRKFTKELKGSPQACEVVKLRDTHMIIKKRVQHWIREGRPNSDDALQNKIREANSLVGAAEKLLKQQVEIRNQRVREEVTLKGVQASVEESKAALVHATLAEKAARETKNGIQRQ